MSRPCALLLLTLFAAVSPRPAEAVVIDWRLGKTSFYLQSSNNVAPTFAVFHDLFAQLGTDTANELTSASLNGATSGSTPLDGLPGGQNWELTAGFATPAALDAAYPAGQYTLNANSGAGSTSEVIALREGLLDDIPYFTGDVYQSLQGVDTAAPIMLEWNTPTTSVSDVHLALDRSIGGSTLVNADVTGETSYQLPAFTLLPGESYTISLMFSSDEADTEDGFDSSGEGASTLATVTLLEFQTAAVPEPSTLCLIGAVVGGGILVIRLR